MKKSSVDFNETGTDNNRRHKINGWVRKMIEEHWVHYLVPRTEVKIARGSIMTALVSR